MDFWPQTHINNENCYQYYEKSLLLSMFKLFKLNRVITGREPGGKLN